MIVSADCPHCGTSKVAFAGRFEFQVTPIQSEKHLLATCSACRNGVIFRLGLFTHTSDVVLLNLIGDQTALQMKILDQWPTRLDDPIPADVPAGVERYFKQALQSLRARNFDAAGMMFRKTLEVATREKASSGAGKPLMKRIDALASGGLITADMRDWAHEVRLGGNDAAHDDEPFEESDAERLHRFTDAFLRYAYTLPAMVAARSGENGSKDLEAA